MSKRETVLCDFELSNWGGERNICGKLKTSTCALCSNDACSEHLLHPNGGLLLRADSIVPGNVQGNSQDLIYPVSGGQIAPYPQVNMNTPMLRLQICTGCRRSLQDNDILEALRSVEKKFVQALAAAITAKALDKK